ncbi:MAG: tetratricopeptide repeat protein [Treponema sp.]|nr:tetratricopeptide repeat protein [Treponema sp.]
MIESCEKLNNQAINLAASGNFEEAIACLKRAITIEKENYLLWFNLGITYRDAGELQKAKEAVEKAFIMNPEDGEIIETLAHLSLTLGNMDEARRYTILGINIQPENAHIWNTTGVVFFKSGEYEEASIAFEQALILNPYYYDALYNLRDTYEELGNKAGYESCVEKLKLWNN